MEINEYLLFEFYEYLEDVKDRTERYCRETMYGIKEFLLRYKGTKNTFNVNIEDIDLGVFSEFTIFLKRKKVGNTSPNFLDGATLAPSTVNKRILALKLLIERSRKYKNIGINVENVEMSKEKRSRKTFLDKEEILQIIEHIENTEKRTETKMRNILLIKTAFNTGLRMSELLSIKVSDIRTDTPFYIKGKGGKERLVDINPELREEMLAYVGYTSKVNRNQGRIIYKSETGFVFINHSDNHYGKQLCSQSASTIIKKLCDDMRLYHGWTKYWTMHTLRHSYASQAVKDGVHIVVLKELMGHEDIRTTNGYTHVDAKFLMEQLYKIQKVI